MRLLVIEDDKDLRHGITQSLREEGYAVDSAADGEEGYYFAMENDYDAILLDAMLPRLDGWKLLERLPEVHARLRSIIRRAYGRASTRLDLGTIQLDTSAKQAYLQGQPITLTAREYALLEYLAFRQGEVVSRTELYEHLFAEEDESFSNLLDVHTCNLRKKLGKDLIQTRRGLGYVLL
jgi:two-component system OmpR family response regulator